jgi:MarR family transcriptional regulator, organic hydroperoxide resistance regulator
MTLTQNELNNSIGSLVYQADRHLINRLQRNFQDSGFDITVEQWKVLLNLFIKDGQNQQELSELTEKDKTSITRLVDGLEKRNLAVRIPDRSDRRNKLIYLTPKGKNMQNELVYNAEKTLVQALKDISEQDIEICRRVLCVIIENLKS